MFARKLHIAKALLRPSNAAFIQNQLTKLPDRINTEGRVKNGWGCYFDGVRQYTQKRTIQTEEERSTVPEYVFEVGLVVFCEPKRGRRDDVLQKEFEKILEIVKTNVNGKKFSVVEEVLELTPEQVDVTKKLPPSGKKRKPRVKKAESTDSAAESNGEVEVEVGVEGEDVPAEV